MTTPVAPKVEAETREPKPQTRRAPYEAPRIEKRRSVARATLVSGRVADSSAGGLIKPA